MSMRRFRLHHSSFILHRCLFAAAFVLWVAQPAPLTWSHMGSRSPADDPSPEALIKAGHWKRARAQVAPLYKANPNDAELNYLMSEIDDAFGDLGNARALAEKAVALKGSESRYHRAAC